MYEGEESNMQLKYRFETIELGNQIIAVPVGKDVDEYHGVIRLNETAALIFNILREEITEKEIVDVLENEYQIDRKILCTDVHNIIEEFRDKELLI